LKKKKDSHDWGRKRDHGLSGRGKKYNEGEWKKKDK